ncbi:MAG: BrxA/BrxB family bacilliredoxin [Flavobacteriaceae bacterium]|nr:BrxA/BrxB family bacilliredoxin [Flavobacteriaceae bacterium]
MYPFEIVKPMKEELTSLGFKDLTTAKEVNKNISSSQTAVLIVNSVCGCAAANARPGVIQSLINDKIPLQLLTVFAGVDKEATDAARVLMVPFPPSSPCIALFKNGELVVVALQYDDFKLINDEWSTFDNQIILDCWRFLDESTFKKSKYECLGRKRV